MRGIYNLWLADTGWDKYTKRQKALVIWWIMSFVAVMASPAAPTFTAFAIMFIISAISFAVSGYKVVKNIEIKE